MSNEIKNKPDKVRSYAKKIGEMTNELTSVKKTAGTSLDSNDGLTAYYSDKIIEVLDNDIKKTFGNLFEHTVKKMNDVAKYFEDTDKNAKV